MRELWAKRIAFVTGIAVVLLAIAFALSQNTKQPSSSSDPTKTGMSDYVGSSVCGKCHTKQFEAWSQSGHAFMLNAVINNQPPRFPFTSVAHPPPGYTWQDIRYVVGGYYWKARFIDQRGYLITGETAQYNLANSASNKQAAWVAYEADKTDKPFNCGTCHTTGYQSQATSPDSPGIHGSWIEAGIGCENCHGPGRRHASTPTHPVQTDRSSDFCGRCHSREPLHDIAMAKGFIRHHQQFNSQRQSKHANLSCNDCHDPHAGVIASRIAKRPAVHTSCTSCHQNIANSHPSQSVHRQLDCIECHMPHLDVTAWSDSSEYTGDMRTHLFAIDPKATTQAVQNNDNSVSIPAISLNFACRSCHRPGGTAADLSTERLRKFATGIHSLQQSNKSEK